MIDTLSAIAFSAWAMYLDSALWLMIGIVAAGLIHALLPKGFLGRFLGGDGTFAVVKAALIGAPLPLCSCGVLPAAVGLRKDGASKGATVSFLISTPETGPDSVALSYALLGPFMAVARPIAAVCSAIISGLLTNVFVRGETDVMPIATPACSSCCDDPDQVERRDRFLARAWSGLRYAFTDILDDVALWLVIGLVLAGAVSALFEPQALAAYGSGIGAMLIMLAVGVPLYVCATASTPIAAGLMAVGVSPGAALVFLLAGPATNIATLGVVAKDLGLRALSGYLLGIAISSLAAGLITDGLLDFWAIRVEVEMATAGEAVPMAIKWASAVLLMPFMVASVGREGAKKLKWIRAHSR